MSNQQLTSREGSINFWTKEKSLIDTIVDGSPLSTSSIILGTFELADGGILISESRDGRIQVAFVVNNAGRVNLTSGSRVMGNEKHMITLTWRKDADLISLYIDGTVANSVSFP